MAAKTKLTPAQKRARLARLDLWRKDPVRFVKDMFKAEPEDYQAEAMRALAAKPDAKVSYRTAHGVGKTCDLFGWTPAWFMVTHIPCRVVITAPTYRQLAKIGWPELQAWHRKSEGRIGGRVTADSFYMSHDRMATMVSTTEPGRWEGWHSKHILVEGDEVKALPKWVFASMDGALTTGETRLQKIASTPGIVTECGEYYEIERGRRGDWKHIHVPASKCKRIPPSVIEDARQRYGEDSVVFITKFLAEFADVSEDILVTLGWVDAARARELEPRGEPVIGIDVARYGRDKSVGFIVQGGVFLDGFSVHGEDTMLIANRADRKARDYGVRQIGVDVNGIGAGVADRLREKGYDVIDHNGGETAYEDDRFVNRKAEIFWNLRELHKAGLIDYHLLPQRMFDDLCAELTSIYFTYDVSGRYKIETREQFRRRLQQRGDELADIHSPDHADAASIALAIEQEDSEMFSAEAMSGMELVGR